MATAVRQSVYDPTSRTISRGTRYASSTRELQQMLKDAGYSPGKVDGIFGAKTESALRKFQVNNGLVPDMIAGQDTWAALAKARPTPKGKPGAEATMGETAPSNVQGKTDSVTVPMALTNDQQDRLYGNRGMVQPAPAPTAIDLGSGPQPQFRMPGGDDLGDGGGGNEEMQRIAAIQRDRELLARALSGAGMSQPQFRMPGDRSPGDLGEMADMPAGAQGGAIDWRFLRR